MNHPLDIRSHADASSGTEADSAVLRAAHFPRCLEQIDSTARLLHQWRMAKAVWNALSVISGHKREPHSAPPQGFRDRPCRLSPQGDVDQCAVQMPLAVDDAQGVIDTGCWPDHFITFILKDGGKVHGHNGLVLDQENARFRHGYLPTNFSLCASHRALFSNRRALGSGAGSPPAPEVRLSVTRASTPCGKTPARQGHCGPDRQQPDEHADDEL